MQQEYDSILVVGAGPAGVSTALWLRFLALGFDWACAAPTVGGTLHRVGNPIDNYPGLPASNGRVLAEQLRQHVESVGLTPELSRRVTALHRDPAGGFQLVFAHTATRHYRRVVLCTGTKPRLLGLAGETRRLRRDVHTGVSDNLSRYPGEAVAVVGGGDGAMEGALLLAERCREVHLIHRRDGFRGQHRFIEAVHAHPKISVHRPQHVAELLVERDRLNGVRLSDGSVLHVRALFERLGVQPELPEGLPADAVDPEGYLRVDTRGRTCWSGLYGAGDICGRDHQSVSTAVGDGARVSLAIQADLGLSGHEHPDYDLTASEKANPDADPARS